MDLLQILVYMAAMLMAAVIATVIWFYATPMEQLTRQNILAAVKVFIVALLSAFVAWLVLLDKADPWTAEGFIAIAVAAAGGMTFLSAMVNGAGLGDRKE